MTTLLKEKTDREVLAAALAEARARTDDLFSILKSDALYERPIPERHRLVFYLGHLEAFDWNLIARQGYGVDAFDPRFDKLFAFGIDPTDGGLPSIGVSGSRSATSRRGSEPSKPSVYGMRGR